MKSYVRLSLVSLAFLAAAAAHAGVTLSYGTTTGAPLTTLTAPAAGNSTTLSVYYASTTALSSGEVLASFDRSTAAGSGATPQDKFVSLSSPVAAPGVVIHGFRNDGGVEFPGVVRPYGLDVFIDPSAGNFSASTTPVKLFDVTLNNLALTTGSYALSFYVYGQAAPDNTSQFFDTQGKLVDSAATPLVVAAPAVPEPATVAVFGLGALAMLRRRTGSSVR